MLKIKAGEAAFDRDSVLFAEVQHSFPVLAGLLRAAVESGNQLNVFARQQFVKFNGAARRLTPRRVLRKLADMVQRAR